MKRVIVDRFLDDGKGTYSILHIAGHPKMWAYVELPWRDNAVGESCIPDGKYPLVRDYYHKGGYPCYMIADVPGRSLIKIHIANRPGELDGCGAPGQWFGMVAGERGVTSSRAAMREFMDAISGDEEAIIVFQHI